MPLFNGFDGEKFVFKGIPDQYFNLLSDEGVQVNAHISGLDNVDQIGIKIGRTRIKCDSINNVPKIDDVPLYRRSHFPIGIEDFDGYAEVIFEQDANNILNSAQGEFVSCIVVNAGKYNFYIIRNKDNKLLIPHYYNFIASIRNPTVRPHGIVGQTADFDSKQRLSEYNATQGEGIIEGDYRDYQVSGLWGDNFKYNKFRASLEGRFGKICRN